MIILIYGTDTFRSKEKLQEVKKQFKEKHDESRMNIVEIDGARASLGEISQAITSSPFLSSKRLVVLKNLLAGDYEIDDAISTVRRAPDGNTVLLFEEKPKKDVKKLLAVKPGIVYEFAPMEGAELLQWVRQRGKLRGLSFIGKSATKLIELVGANAWQLAAEISKLAHLGKKETSEEDVCSIVFGSPEGNVFGFIDAFALRQQKQALSLLRQELETTNDAGRLMHLVTRQIRILLQIKKIAPKEQSKLGLPPFVFEKARRQAALWQDSELLRAHERLLEADKLAKTTTLSAETILVNLISLLPGSASS